MRAHIVAVPLFAFVLGLATTSGIPESCAAAGTGTLQGVVRLGQARAPYANVSIAGTSLHTQADSVGFFVLPGVPTGAQTVILTRFGNAVGRLAVLVHSGLSPLQFYAMGNGPDPASEAGRVLAEQDSSAGTIKGTVTGPDSLPVGFANMVVLGTRRGAATDEDGKFEITRVPPGRYAVRVQSVGSEPVIDSVEVTRGKAVALNVHVGGSDRRTEVVWGRGRDPWADTTFAGHPIWPGTFLLPCLGSRGSKGADTLEASPLPQTDVVTSPRGRFELRVIPGTSGVLRVHYILHPGVLLSSLRVLDEDGTLTESLHWTSGDSSDGTAYWNREYRDASLAPPGRYHVRFKSSAGEDDVPVELLWARVRPDSIPDRCVVLGVVVDSTGMAIPATTVAVGAHYECRATTDANGRFELSCIPPGQWDIYTPEFARTPGRVSLKLAPRSKVVVRVVVPGGNRVR